MTNTLALHIFSPVIFKNATKMKAAQNIWNGIVWGEIFQIQCFFILSHLFCLQRDWKNILEKS